MPVNAELVSSLLQPIPGENPSGKDLRYDARVDAIKEARREDVMPDQQGNQKVADVATVITGVTALLSKETKDLQLAAWLTEALLRKQGIGGLATGLDTLRGLLDQFWESIYPLPEDDDLELRTGPLEWVGTRLVVPIRRAPLTPNGFSYADYESSRLIPSEAEAEEDREKAAIRADAIEQRKPMPDQVDAALDALNKVQVRSLIADVDAASGALAALEKVADEKFGRDAPPFNPLRSTLDELRRFLGGMLAQKLELDPDPIEEIPETGSSDDGGAVDESGAISVEPTNINDASRRIAVITRWFRQQDPTNPAPYLMLRGFRWGELRANAPELDPKLLEAPPTASRARLKSYLIDGRWPELLEQGEALMATAQGRGWLDLQRYTLTACANLGSSYDGVAAVVRSELRALLAALPQLRGMTLMDDTPTANAETQQWLANEGLVGGDADESAPPADEATDESADVEADDGSGVMSDALADDASLAQLGGLSRGRRSRRHSNNGARDPFDMARAELSMNRPNRAIELLMAELAREHSPRGRFVRQTQVAYVMVEGGLEHVAKPILDQLVQTIDERGLEAWESGPLVAQPLALLCRVLDRTGGDEEQRANLYLRVCRLDPLQAIALQGR